MRRFLLLLLLCLPLPGHAQEEGWPIVENCLGELPYPTIPHANWDFEGVIFSYNRQGTRAIRTDVETSYFIAFDDEANFPASGGFSPDGRWFAYPIGSRADNVNSGGESTFLIEGISIVSTDIRNIQNSYAFTDDRFEFFYGSNTYTFNRYSGYLYRLIWLDNERILYLGTGNYEPVVFDTRVSEYIADPLFDERLLHEATIWEDIEWLPNDAGYIRTEFDVYPSPISWFDSANQLIEVIGQASFGSLALAPNSQSLAFFKDNRLHLADLEARSVENLCLEVLYSGGFGFPEVLWSPDSNYLAFLYDGYPVLLNLETREMQILRYETESLMGWYPLEERYD